MTNKYKVLVSLFATVFLGILSFYQLIKQKRQLLLDIILLLVVLVIISNVKKDILTTKKTCNLVFVE